MPRYRTTEADLRRRLEDSGYPFDDDTVPDRIRVLLGMCERDLAAARLLLGQSEASLGDQALQHLEEVGMRLGEALAFGLGYRISDNAAGYHRRAIAVLVEYAAVHLPKVAAAATEFDRIGRARNSVKDPDDLDYETATEADARRWLITATAVLEAVKGEPMRRWHRGEPGRSDFEAHHPA